MKKIKPRYLGMLFTLLLLITSCVKKESCDECFTPPPQLYFKIISAENGEDLLSNFTYTSENISLYYLDNDEKVSLRLQYFQIDGQWIISSSEMSWYAISDSGQTFYLELNANTTETIHLKIAAVFENCCTYHTVETLTINNVNAEIEPYTNYIIIRK
ncbi:MAG: hypothetical protein JW857_04495 [Bacteroidales bacterium]|nr:hypothetical protein [Bacteroidales bacterium]